MVLPAGFSLTVCATLLGAAGIVLFALGIHEAARGVPTVGGVIGSSDLAATGGTMIGASQLCSVLLVRQTTCPHRASR